MQIHRYENQTQLSPFARGLSYGDGFFTTARIQDQQVLLLPLHLERLSMAAERLQFNDFDALKMAQYLMDLVLPEQAVLKVIVTREAAERGYAIPQNCRCQVLVSIEPTSIEYCASHPLRLMVCQTPVSLQPMLAGIKHLNRLDNVLAKTEVQSLEFDDGLMLAPRLSTTLNSEPNNRHAHVVCSTQANVWLQMRGKVITPALKDAGVNGIIRQLLLAEHPNAEEVDVVRLSDFAKAEEVFLSNAVRGIMPIAQVGEQHYHQHTKTQQLSDWLKALAHD
ncbi:MAG: aminodeoxychorismate lyase [Gammaproteobacteria bacterium]|nr:aminodeoxychorismate lyase [Gammaproteobacteria bacterium]